MFCLGGIEAGGTKFVCGVGSCPEDLHTIEIPTSDPDCTLSEVERFFREYAGERLKALGVGSFGPVDIHRGSPHFGYITSTPKAGWRNFDLAGELRRRLGIPVGFDTDVNAAAIGEAKWGAARGLTDFLYLTVGTGIGGGAFVNGDLVHGLMHPEMGHIRIPHNLSDDPFRGICPYHGDCLEGLASGPAIEARWGAPAQELPAGHPAWKLEAYYLALGLMAWVCTLAPQRVIVGGGVIQQPVLLPMVRQELVRLLNGYIQARELIEELDTYIVPPQLGRQAGVLGALVLAERALEAHSGKM
jgi:fructokinase